MALKGEKERSISATKPGYRLPYFQPYSSNFLVSYLKYVVNPLVGDFLL
jgi:hypothetical protein